jgi:excisionase family DNA binding protein
MNDLISTYNIETLADRLADVLEHRFPMLKAQKQPEPEPQEQRFHTTDEVSKRYNLGSLTLYKLRKAGKIPFHKAGARRILYDFTELDKIFLTKHN